MNHPQRKGFTLIELLTVIAIIGILASILIPTIGTVMETARKASASSNARQIAQSYIAFANGGARQRTISKSGSDITKNQASKVSDWAAVLAIRTELNDASLWFITSDDRVSAISVMPRQVVKSTSAPSPEIDSDFLAAKPKSWAVVAGMSTSAPPTTTPLIWTRGLDETNGTWSTTDSPWKGKGGHLAFLDGHVAWYGSLDPDINDGEELSPYPTSGVTTPVSSILNAIPAAGVALILDPDDEGN